MKVSKQQRKLAARQADFDAMRAQGGDSKKKWILVSGSKTQCYHRPGSMKK